MFHYRYIYETVFGTKWQDLDAEDDEAADRIFWDGKIRDLNEIVMVSKSTLLVEGSPHVVDDERIDGEPGTLEIDGVLHQKPAIAEEPCVGVPPRHDDATLARSFPQDGDAPGRARPDDLRDHLAPGLLDSPLFEKAGERTGRGATCKSGGVADHAEETADERAEGGVYPGKRRDGGIERGGEQPRRCGGDDGGQDRSAEIDALGHGEPFRRVTKMGQIIALAACAALSFCIGMAIAPRR